MTKRKNESAKVKMSQVETPPGPKISVFEMVQKVGLLTMENDWYREEVTKLREEIVTLRAVEATDTKDPTKVKGKD